MENHPIPQDITGFQFKLIGNMTVKQFAYLASSVVLAWIALSLPIAPFIKLPIALSFVLFGISLVFIPIAGRPMDVIIANFAKSLFRPTQFVYRKQGTQLFYQNFTPGTSPTQNFPLPYPSEPAPKDQPTTNAPPKNPSQQPSPVPPPRIISISDYQNPIGNKTEEKTSEPVKEKEDLVEKALEELRKESASLQKKSFSEFPLETNKKAEGSLQLGQQTMAQQDKSRPLQTLTPQEKLELEKNKMAFLQKPKILTQNQAEPGQNVRSISKDMGKNAGLLATPEAPNLITGIVKDPRKNALPNILIEIKDGEGNPVRAFKTNGLGQFASATPLLNGNYIIELEDPRGENKFGAIRFTAKGEIILPIEITSIDPREELRRSLFNV